MMSVLMDEEFSTLYYDVEKAIDYAFEGKFVLKLYDYFNVCNAKRRHAEDFIQSKTASEITLLILDLEKYLEGGQDSTHKQLREGYGHIPKPQARKIKKYLCDILNDAWRYSNDKKPGRRKRTTK